MKELSLRCNEITNLESLAAVGNTLECLNLSSNGLTEVPQLPQLLALKELRLAGNRIKNLDGLAEVVGNTLEVLDLNHNSLDEIPDLSQFPHLKVLDLTFNRITSLDGLAHLANTSLERLYIRLPDDHNKKSLPEGILLPRTLKELRMYNVDAPALWTAHIQSSLGTLVVTLEKHEELLYRARLMSGEYIVSEPKKLEEVKTACRERLQTLRVFLNGIQKCLDLESVLEFV